MGSFQGLKEIVDLIRKRRFLVLGVALTVLFVAMLATFIVPREYESFTVVRLLDNQALMEAYGHDTTEGGSRIAMAGTLREDLTNREAALAAVEDLDLAARLEDMSPTEKAAERDRIVTAIREGTTVEELDAETGEIRFRVTTRGSDPDLTLRLLTRLVTGYQQRKYAERDVDSSGEYVKVRDELATTETAHVKAAKDLEDFVALHQEHRFGEEADTAGRLGREKAALAKVDREIAAITTRLEDVRAQLAEESEWRELEQGEESESGKVKNEVWDDLKASERALYSEVAVKKRIRKTHVGRVEDLSELVRAFPELEMRWKELGKTTADLLTRRDELREREVTSREAWQAKASEGAMVFDVLDAPGRPDGPAGNGRLLVSVAGLLVGLCGGIGSVVVMGLTDKSYHRSDELAAALAVPVLGAIARIETPVEREESKRRTRRAAMAVGVLAVLVGMTVVAQLVFDETISTFVRNVVSL